LSQIGITAWSLNPLLALKQQGQSHWNDDLMQEMFQDGSLRHRVHKEGLTSVTSNPAICNLAIAGNDWYVFDAGVGALTYSLEILIGVVGCARRWRTMPWLIVAFGIMIAPLGVVSIIFIIIQPIVSGTWRMLAMLPRAAEFYRDQIDRGLDGDLVAAAKARTILREMLGEIMLSPGEDGSLWAECAMQPAALLQGARTCGRGDRI
jgi:hypothetical protein